MKAKAVRGIPLIEKSVTTARLRWPAATVAVALVLLLFLLLAAYLDGPLNERLTWQYLRGPLLPVSIIIYVPAFYPLLRRLSDRVVLALSSMLMADSIRETHEPWGISHRRRSEATSAVAGAASWMLLSQPWSWVDRPLAAYAAAADAIMFGMLGVVVFHALSEARSISRLERTALKIDIFDMSPLIPVARWSLGISMTFLGGISITIAFQTVESLRLWQNIVVYLCIIIVALLVFFVCAWSTHMAIARTKRSQLDIIRNRLDAGFRRLQSLGSEGKDERINNEISAWAAFEKRIEGVSEWPYDVRILRRLLASAMIPSIVYVLRLLGVSL